MPNTTEDEFPKCRICDKPVTFSEDTVADENGHPVHEDCFAKRLLANSPIRHRGNTLDKIKVCENCSVLRAEAQKGLGVFDTRHTPRKYPVYIFPVMKGATGERWKQLCEQAAVEQDQDKLYELIKRD
jgi:hypothetical protein